MIDFAVIAAHADDAELGCGGTIASLVAQGHTGAIIDVTDASAATRGSAILRKQEARQAANILGVQQRISLDLLDAHLLLSESAINSVVQILRSLRPRAVFTHYADDRHPDHFTVCQIVQHAWYKAGLAGYHPELGSPHRPFRLFHFFGPVLGEVRFCVDISDYWECKMRAVLAYESQFHNPKSQLYGAETTIASKAFMDFVESRGRHFGSLIRTRYGEGFWCRETAQVHNPLSLATNFF